LQHIHQIFPKKCYVPNTHNLGFTRSKIPKFAVVVVLEKAKTQETSFSRSEKVLATHLGPSTKGPQNLFIIVLASKKCPYPSQNGKPGDGVGGSVY